MTFGELMMLVGAFNQVQQSLRWFVDNFPSIADWRATLLRVASFRNTLSTMDDLGRNAGQIEVAETDDGCIRMDDLAIAAPSSPVKPVERHVELKPGERVLVIGDEAQEALMFRAVSGLWPWGSGRIARPPRESIIFIPAPGYIPPGTLRSALSYPRLGEASDPATVSDVLATVGLDYLKPLLNKEDRWDRRLSDAEKQRLSVARVILQKPRWVVLNQAMAGLDPETRRRRQISIAIPESSSSYKPPSPSSLGFLFARSGAAVDRSPRDKLVSYPRRPREPAARYSSLLDGLNADGPST